MQPEPEPEPAEPAAEPETGAFSVSAWERASVSGVQSTTAWRGIGPANKDDPER